jgi:hypothetical protein
MLTTTSIGASLTVAVGRRASAAISPTLNLDEGA